MVRWPTRCLLGSIKSNFPPISQPPSPIPHQNINLILFFSILFAFIHLLERLPLSLSSFIVQSHFCIVSIYFIINTTLLLNKNAERAPSPCPCGSSVRQPSGQPGRQTGCHSVHCSFGTPTSRMFRRCGWLIWHCGAKSHHSCTRQEAGCNSNLRVCFQPQNQSTQNTTRY